MPERRQFDFFLLRYVPDAVKDEFVNIGLVLMNGDTAEVRFTDDWRRVRCLDPSADIEMLQSLELELRRKLAQDAPDRERLLKFLNESFSNTLQLSPTKSCLAESAAAEADRLVQMYLETHRLAGRRNEAASNRQAILGRMRDAFEQQGVWRSMSHDIAAAEYTHKGDPFKIDCGYRPYGNGSVKMFHAVSLATDLNSAKVLAFTFPQVREGMARTSKLDASLTAIVEDDLARDDDAIAFALDTFSRSQIAVAPVSQLPDLAEVARKEMKV